MDIAQLISEEILSRNNEYTNYFHPSGMSISVPFAPEEILQKPV